jgi:hypothetical protein
MRVDSIILSDAISDRCRKAESIFKECSGRESARREIDLRLIADSKRLIAESRELLLKIEKFSKL